MYVQLGNMSTSAGTTKDAPHTRYVGQLIESTEVPFSHTWGVSFASWLLLAGFIVIPGTFTSQSLKKDAVSNVELWVFTKIQYLPLLGVAGICSGVGALGMIVFWVYWRNNYHVIKHEVFGVRLMCYI